MADNDIIAAIATAAGRSGIGVVRVSGPTLGAFNQAILGKSPAPRTALMAEFLDKYGAAIDQGIALYFPAPRSYSGEDVLELQGHGGPVVLRELLKRCFELGARPARPGEFTERAFLNDKLDLAQAESVADLIDASTAQAARSAMRSLQGEFSRRVESLMQAIIELRALVEATLDFPDEEIDFLTQGGAEDRLDAVIARLEEVTSASRQGSLLREGVRIVLAGQPNVGKSSLLNRIAGEDLAIVTEIPGTTRDAIRQSINLDGVPAHVIDTAGLRRSDDPVEKAGMERTWAAIAKADLVVLLMDARQGETDADRAILGQLPASLPRVRVMNKADLLSRGSRRETTPDGVLIWLSAKTGEGIELLQQTILERIGWHPDDEDVFMARERHLQALERARTHLRRAKGLGGKLELYAEELRLALESLGSITGRVTPDDLLGEIFSRFCIGK